MPATVAVEGMEISPDDLDEPGWKAAFGGRRKQATSTPPYGGLLSIQNTPVGSRTAKPPAKKSLIKKITNASRLPQLPKDQVKVIARPKGGLHGKLTSYYSPQLWPWRRP